jgi:hypothetical protein
MCVCGLHCRIGIPRRVYCSALSPPPSITVNWSRTRLCATRLFTQYDPRASGITWNQRNGFPIKRLTLRISGLRMEIDHDARSQRSGRSSHTGHVLLSAALLVMVRRHIGLRKWCGDILRHISQTETVFCTSRKFTTPLYGKPSLIRSIGGGCPY